MVERYYYSSDTVRVNDNEVVLACNYGYGECIPLHDVHNFSVYNKEIHTSGNTRYGSEGLDIQDESSNGVVYNNYIHDLDKTGLYPDGWDGPDNPYDGGIVVFPSILQTLISSTISIVVILTSRWGLIPLRR